MLRPAPPAPMTLESNRNPVPAWIRVRTSLLVVCLLVLLPARQTFGQDAIARGTSWQARWIGVAEEGDRSPPNTWICFRREVELARAPQRVSARIAVDSRYWLWINGELAVYEGGLKRGPTPKDTYYDEVDLSGRWQAGTNTVVVLLWHFGKHGFSHKSSGRAGLLVEMELDDEVLLSDARWRARVHPGYGTAEAPPAPNYRLVESNVRFDARMDLDGWLQPGYEDREWPAAVEYGVPPVGPWNDLVRRPIPLLRDLGRRRYERLELLDPVAGKRTIVAHLARNATLHPYLKVRAPEGLTIDIRTDNYRGGGEYNLRHEYVTRSGVQEYEALGYLNGHSVHYTVPEDVEVLELAWRETRYDTDILGAFTCSDPFYDRLWRKSVDTMLLNMRDGIQDPDRERAQWWGDATIVLGEIFNSCDERGHRLVRKAILNLVDWQREDGVLYSPVPGNWRKELPMQMLASVGEYGIWRYVLYSGDVDLLREVYPRLLKYLDLWELGADGLVVPRAGDWTWGDWGAHKDMPVLFNAWYALALRGQRAMAAELGDEGRVQEAERRLATLAESFERNFWTGSAYRSAEHPQRTDDRANALAVIAGLVDVEQYPAISSVLRRQHHASPYMEKYVLQALLRMGYTDAALTRMKLRFGPMVASEHSTLWEQWEWSPEGKSSYNHAWSGGPMILLDEYVAGIAPLEPGYATYRVRPQLGRLVAVRAEVPSVKGLIRVRVDRDRTHYRLRLESPANTIAIVHVPVDAVEDLGRIRANGVLVWAPGGEVASVEGLEYLGRSGGHHRFAAAPGVWRLEAVRE